MKRAPKDVAVPIVLIKQSRWLPQRCFQLVWRPRHRRENWVAAVGDLSAFMLMNLHEYEDLSPESVADVACVAKGPTYERALGLASSEWLQLHKERRAMQRELNDLYGTK